MRVRRGLLFWGLFLIPLGGISLLVRAGIVGADQLSGAWRLWPLILIAIGLAIVLGRVRTTVLATAIVAIVAGSIGGAVLAGGPIWFGDCAIAGSSADQRLERTGQLEVGAAIRLDLRCGSVAVTTETGSDWRIDAVYRKTAPIIDATTSRLAVRAPDDRAEQHQQWRIDLPAAMIGTMAVNASAASATVDLPGAHVAELVADVNAGDLRIDASAGSLDEVDLTMNAGRIRLALGATAIRGRLSINAGAIDLCVPDGMSLRFQVNDQLTFAHNLGSRGLTRSGNTWRLDAPGGAQAVDLSIEGNAASLTLNPGGGCR
ncbi:MAG TPA: hypothetical protein VFK35_01410 [Candidatus Limnocylindrales bacterium]|nr:hypothetical protein [Candidatus Limnocylindrales bacterium]